MWRFIYHIFILGVSFIQNIKVLCKINSYIRKNYTIVLDCLLKIFDFFNIFTGKWEIICEPFWTFPSDYSKMYSEALELYKKLSQSDLLLFKGDLNYRKLVGDIFWEPTTPFQVALRGFEPTNILSLRTIKADAICGLPRGVAEELNARENNWVTTGKYALITHFQK